MKLMKGEWKMKQQLIGIILGVLVLVAFLSSEPAVASSPVFLILFGAYLLGISWFGRDKGVRE